MTTKSVIIVIAIIAIILIGFFSFFPRQKPSPPSSSLSQITEITPPPATGNVDDLIDSMLKEITDEELLIDEEDKDASLVISDLQEISDFGQTINESEF